MKKIRYAISFTCLVLVALACYPWLQAQQRRPAVKRSYGLKRMDPQRYQSMTKALTPVGGAALPTSVDLSAGMPPPGDQGSESSCTTWATAYAVRTYLEKAEQSWDVSTPVHQFSPAFLYNQLARGNCATTLDITQALDLLVSEGAVTLTTMPYMDGQCGALPNGQVLQQAAPYRIGGYRRLNEQNANEIKAQLNAHYPVLVSIDTDDTFDGLGPNQAWSSHGNITGSHAVALVGYNDSARNFKLINSWGTNWGSNGYGYITYDLFPQIVHEALVVSPFHNHTTSPTAAPFSAVSIVSMTAASPPNPPGLAANIQVTMRGYSGHSTQVAVHFFFTTGVELPASGGYADVNGYAAVGTAPVTVPGDDIENAVYPQPIPIEALGAVTGGVQLMARADLFVDNFGVAQSQMYPFMLGSAPQYQQPLQPPPPTGITVNAPRMSNGYAVDWCLHWGTQCGQPAANYYCQQLHYAGAASYQTANMQPTWVMADGRSCASGCAGFTQITCGGAGGARQRQ